MTVNKDLLPCPYGCRRDVFIGGTVSDQKWENYWVECLACAATGPKHQTKEDATKAWNDLSRKVSEPEWVDRPTEEGWYWVKQRNRNEPVYMYKTKIEGWMFDDHIFCEVSDHRITKGMKFFGPLAIAPKDD